MSEEQQNKQEQEEFKLNYFKNTKEWFEIIKWVIIFSVAVIVPGSGLIYFWTKFRPPFEVFLTLIVLYLLVTLLLIKPLVSRKND